MCLAPNPCVICRLFATCKMQRVVLVCVALVTACALPINDNWRTSLKVNNTFFYNEDVQMFGECAFESYSLFEMPKNVGWRTQDRSQFFVELPLSLSPDLTNEVFWVEVEAIYDGKPYEFVHKGMRLRHNLRVHLPAPPNFTSGKNIILVFKVTLSKCVSSEAVVRLVET